MAKTSAGLLPGTLDMLILKAVSLKPLHGYGVLLRIAQISNDILDVPQGRCIRRCTASNTRASSTPSGAKVRTSAARSSTR